MAAEDGRARLPPVLFSVPTKKQHNVAPRELSLIHDLQTATAWRAVQEELKVGKTDEFLTYATETHAGTAYESSAMSFSVLDHPSRDR